jgi:hypothetical protein
MGAVEWLCWLVCQGWVSLFFAGVFYPTIFPTPILLYLYTIELKIIGVSPVIGSPEIKIISRLSVRLPLLSLLA